MEKKFLSCGGLVAVLIFIWLPLADKFRTKLYEEVMEFGEQIKVFNFDGNAVLT